MNKLRKLNSKYMFLILVFIICFIGLFVYLKGDMYKCKILSEDEFATLKTWTVEKDNSKVILPCGFKYTGEPIVLTKKIRCRLPQHVFPLTFQVISALLYSPQTLYL